MGETAAIDPDSLHCKRDPHICRGEAFCACDCENCELAHKASADFYAAKHPSLLEPLAIVEDRTLTQRVLDGDATPDELQALSDVVSDTAHKIAVWLLTADVAARVGSETYGTRKILARLIDSGVWKPARAIERPA